MQVVPSLYRGRASAPDLQFRRDSTRRAQDAVQDAQEEVKHGILYLGQTATLMHKDLTTRITLHGTGEAPVVSHGQQAGFCDRTEAEYVL